MVLEVTIEDDETALRDYELVEDLKPYREWCVPANLCKHHPRVKHQAGWKLTMTREGEWTDPHGRQYATHPTNHHELAA